MFSALRVFDYRFYNFFLLYQYFLCVYGSAEYKGKLLCLKFRPVSCCANCVSEYDVFCLLRRFSTFSPNFCFLAFWFPHSGASALKLHGTDICMSLKINSSSKTFRPSSILAQQSVHLTIFVPLIHIPARAEKVMSK